MKKFIRRFNPRKELKALFSKKGSLTVLLDSLTKIKNEKYDCDFQKLKAFVEAVVNFQKKDWPILTKIIQGVKEDHDIYARIFSFKTQMLFIGIENLKEDQHRSPLKVDITNEEPLSDMNIRFVNNFSSDKDNYFTNPIKYLKTLKNNQDLMLSLTFKKALEDNNALIGRIDVIIENLESLKKLIYTQPPK